MFFKEICDFISLFLAYTIKWIDPTGIKLSATSNFWCDPTAHAGYQLTKQPSMQTRQSRIGDTFKEKMNLFF